MLDLENDSQNAAELIYQESCLLSHNQEGGIQEAAPGAVDLKNTIAAIQQSERGQKARNRTPLLPPPHLPTCWDVEPSHCHPHNWTLDTQEVGD